MSKCIAIIPARGGSKRIPRKNIKEFHGKPIISYTIQTAKKSNLFDKIIVSTDDNEIAKVALKYGASVHNRPKELADDYVHVGDVVKDVISTLKNSGEKIDLMCLLYATSPFLDSKYLIEGFKKLKNSDAHQAIAVTTMPFPIQRTFKITDNDRCQMFWPENFHKRSQDLDEAYQDAAQFLWINFNNSSNEIPYGKDTIAVQIPRYLVQDIDTPEDWKRAEFMYEALKQSGEI